LRPAHIPGKFAREGRQIHVVAGRAPEDLSVAHPAEPLVALRAVVGMPTKFERCPHRMLLHNWLIIALPVSSLAVKGASVWKTRAVTALLWRRGRQPGHFNVAEAVESELRSELFRAIAAEDEVIVALAVRRLSV
jgi:hypothetical protein